MAVAIRPADRPGDLGWIVQAHGELYARELGWDVSFERLVAGIVGGLDAVRDKVWIAELDGVRVGCVSCMTADDGDAVLRILLVHPDGRGHGVGSKLVDTCLDHARDRASSGCGCGPPTGRRRPVRSTCAAASRSSASSSRSTGSGPRSSARPIA